MYSSTTMFPKLMDSGKISGGQLPSSRSRPFIYIEILFLS
jgi:hypothetical protein